MIKEYNDYADNQERARQFPVGPQSPMRKVPGFSQKSAKWDAYLGRWVIYRKVR